MRYLIIAILILAGCASSNKLDYKRNNGMVPDEKTAKAIAVAVAIPIYGKNVVENELPFDAVLRNGVWWVYGKPKNATKDTMGSFLTVKISKSDGRIIELYH